MPKFVEFVEAGTKETSLKPEENPHIDTESIFINPEKVIAVRESFLSMAYCIIMFESNDIGKTVGQSLVVKGSLEEVIEALSA